MAIANDFFVDYQNKLIVHTQLIVYYTTPGTGGFTIGETVTWPTTQQAIVVGEDTTNDILWLVYNTNTPTTELITGSSSGATCTVSATSALNRATLSYTGTGGKSAGERITFTGSGAIGTVVSDDTANNILVFEALNGTPADADTMDGTGTGTVSGNPVIQQRTYTSRALYSFLQDTFDDLDQMDDTVPMSAQTPTEFTVINGWFIDDDSVKYLTGGAITTSGYTNEIRVVSWTASTVEPTPDEIGLTVTQAVTGDTGTLLHYNNTVDKMWVRMDDTGDLFDEAQDITSTDTLNVTSAASSSTGEDLYANIYTLGTIAVDPNPKTYIFQNAASLTEWWGRGDATAHIDVLIKVQEADVAIDGYDITVFARHFSDTYDHFTIDLTSGGRNAVPLATATDLNNNTTGEVTLAYSSGSGTWTVGQFVRDVNTLAYGEILADAGGVLTVGNVIAGSVSPYEFDPAASALQESSDGIQNDGDASADLDTVTGVVRGYNNIGIYFVNVTVDYTSGGNTAPTLYETFTGASSGATGVLLAYSTDSGAWTDGDAAGTFTIGNWDSTTWTASELITGSTTGADTAAISGTPAETVTSTIPKAFEQGSNYNYNVIVEMQGRTMAQVYEWFKYVTREDANSSQDAVFNFVTMYRVDTGAVVEEDGEEYISAQSTYSPVKASPFGTFAGGKLFGARGVWLENMATADRQNFQLIDADGTTQVPPNFQTVTVNSVAVGDKVTVFRTSSGTTLDRALYTSTAANSSGDPDFVVGTAISSDTPNSGYIRVVDTSDTSINRETRYPYSSWSTSTFTLSGSETLDRTYTTDDTTYVPYFDEIAADTTVSVTVIYTADRTVLTRVRRYGGVGDSILPFQVTGTFGSTGYTAAAIRTDDTIVT